MVKDNQLEKMSVKDLLALEAAVQAAIAERKVAEKSEVKEKLQALAEKSGYSVDELFGKGRRANGGGKGSVAAKYRNPANAEQTWTGRGRAPAWAQALKTAGTLASALIETGATAAPANSGSHNAAAAAA